MRRLALVFFALLLTLSWLPLARASTAHKSTTHRKRAKCVRGHMTRRVHGRKVVSKCTTKTKHKSKPKPKAHHAAPRDATSGNLIVGLSTSTGGYGGASLAPRLHQVISQTDAKWLREQFLWSTIEPQPGQFSWSYFDHYMLQAARDGEHVLPVLMHTPGWAGATPTTIPSDPTAYAQYVAAVVGRYGPNGTFWNAHPNLSNYAVQWFEIWHEPYFDNGDNGDYNPGRYANLVKATALAGRAVDPDAKFLLAAEYTGVQVGSNWIPWVDALYKAMPDLNSYFDGVAIHPYGSDVTGFSKSDPWNQLRRAEIIHDEFVSHGAADKPFWITEVGYPTCTSGSIQCVSPAGQANDISTLFNYATGAWKDWIQAVFVFRYDDYGSDPSDSETDYGLTYTNHAPKPALAVFKAEAQQYDR
jgi:hypothetical protein